MKQKLIPPRLKNRLFSVLLAASLLFPLWTLADEDFRFTDIDIPVEPVTSDGVDRYTEDLWEINDAGIFNEDGQAVSAFEPSESKPEVQKKSEPAEVESVGDYQQTLSGWNDQAGLAKQRVTGLKANLEEQQRRFNELEKKIESTEEKLAPIREETTQLQGQIELLNQQIRFTKEKMTNAEILIAEKQIEMKDGMLFLQRSEVEVEIQKKVVLDYVKLLYQEENRFFDLYDNSSSSLKLLLADSSVSDNLVGKEYVQIMEHTGRKVIYELDKTRQEMLTKQQDLIDQQEDLNFLYQSLAKEKRTNEESRAFKKDLLEKTKGQEEDYQLLLERAVQEQLETSLSVQNLQQSLDLIEGKLQLLDQASPNTQALEEVGEVLNIEQSIRGVAPENGQEEEVENGKPLDWPIPANKITTLFHDPTYPKKWGTHQAIDIRAKQFTEIRAPANGYVFQTRDNGMGYSYIILAHKNNLVTVYGHVAEILVKAGTTVRKGELIALSGGTPGTKGAGLQTTGPHLHFEVHYKGKPVNPLDYLPLEELPIEYVPDEYLKKLKL